MWLAGTKKRKANVNHHFAYYVVRRLSSKKSLFVPCFKFAGKVLNAQAFLGEQHYKVID